MKNIFKSILALMCCGAICASCNKQEAQAPEMSADLTSIEVEAHNPDQSEGLHLRGSKPISWWYS